MTPEIQLRTMLVLDERGRAVSTVEPKPAPLFMLMRSASSCAWAIRADLPEQLAAELERLAREERPYRDPRDAPLHTEKYRSLLKGQIVFGPAFTFPDAIAHVPGLTPVDKLELLERHFRGWTAAEIPGCSPILAVMADGYPVSVCFCARKTDTAAEAGVETAAAFRGRGFAPRVTAAWAAAIRASGRIPLYSTSWSNTASLAVARKLGLTQYASDWSIVEPATT
jgi:hypothetical protein